MKICCPFCETELSIDQSVASYYCYCGKSSDNADNLTFFYGSKDIFTLYVNFVNGCYFTFDWTYDSYRIFSVDENRTVTKIGGEAGTEMTPKEAMSILKRFIKLKVFA